MEKANFVLRERYRFVAELGRGGMSVVYLAQDLNLDSYWAVKEVANNSSVELNAFKKEVELLSSLSYPAIPRIVDRIEIGGSYFVVMDFVDGASLAHKVNVEGPQSEKTVVDWSKNLCEVLLYLHTAKENPIIYRDIKPDNIMLTQSGQIRLIDFGIAIETKRGKKIETESLGTKGFAAPEQYRGASNILDERTDIYSLGATMFYLLTGQSPKKPPNGVPRLRKILSDASEGIEYIIARCTADNPDDRYDSVSEVLADLENIENLTRSYRKTMKTRLALFAGSLALSLIFAIVGTLGFTWMKSDLEKTYQGAMQSAAQSERTKAYDKAAEHYLVAIEAKQDNRETYVLLFNAMLPQEGGSGRVAQTKFAIDEMRKLFLDNPESAMYQDPELMYMVAKQCIDIQDPAYAGYAINYFRIIKNSDAYKNGEFSAREIQSYGVFASFIKQDATAESLGNFTNELEELEEYTDTAKISVDERLTNYYTLVRMYSSYMSDLENAPEKIYSIGTKAREILEANLSAEEVKFNNIIPFYETVAGGLYNGADIQTELSEKEVFYKRSIEWFMYLDDLGIELEEQLALKKGNAYKGVFDLHNTPSEQSSISEEYRQYVREAIEIYEKIVKKYPGSFEAHVYLTQAYLDNELAKPSGQQNFKIVQDMYEKTKQIRDSSDKHSAVTLIRFAALARQIENLNIEVLQK